MGMYTELCLGVEFKPTIPAEVVAILSFMATQPDEPNALPTMPLPDHPLFSKKSRWMWMLRAGGSYYFDAQPCLVWRFDDIAKAWFLTVLTNIKNYENEWYHFLEWIAPFVDTDRELAGHIRYEKDPCGEAIFFVDGAVERVPIVAPAWGEPRED